jgi:hypothetical protein
MGCWNNGMSEFRLLFKTVLRNLKGYIKKWLKTKKRISLEGQYMYFLWFFPSSHHPFIPSVYFASCAYSI